MMANLTDKQRRFIEEYCVDFNATKAARRAGYSERSAKHIGSENLSKPHLRAAIDERMSQLSMSAAEATMRLTQMGRGSLEPFLTPDGTLDLESEEARSHLPLLKKLKIKERRVGDGVIERRSEIELHDAKDAVIQIAKIRGLYKDENPDINVNVLMVRDVDDLG